MADKSENDLLRELGEKFMQLFINGLTRPGAGDVKPVLKFCTLDANAVWLLTEVDPQDPYIAFGLCDLGLGHPEIGSVDLRELMRLRGPLGYPIAIEANFEADKTLAEYADDARRRGHIKT